MLPAKTLPLALLISGFALLGTGCFSSSSSGSGDDKEPADSGSGVSGTAATGAPVIDGRVCLREKGVSANANCTLETTTDDEGEYSFGEEDLEGLDYPLRIAISGMSAGGNPVGMTTVVHDSNQGSANITPLTEALLSAANNGGAGSELTSEDIESLDLDSAQQGLRGILQQEGVLTRLGIDANIDFIDDPDFAADRTGLDALLDLVSIESFEIDDDGNFRIQITDMGDRSKRLVISTDNGGWSVDEDASDFENSLRGADLDLKDIDSLYERLSNLMLSEASEAEYAPLFTDDFLDRGDDADHIIGLLADRTEDSFFGPVETFGRASLEGCTSDGACNARADALDADGDRHDVMDLRVKKHNGEWLFYGDQREHNFSLQLFAERTGSLGDQVEAELGLQFQMNPTDDENSEVSGATLYADRGEAELVEIMSFKECDSEWLCQVNESNKTAGGNMMVMSESELADMARDDGSYTVKLYRDSERENLEQSYENVALRNEPFRGSPSSTHRRFANLTDESLSRIEDVSSETESLRLDWESDSSSMVEEAIFFAGTSNTQYRVKNRYRNRETGGDFDLRNPNNCDSEDKSEECTMEDYSGGLKGVILITRDSRGRSYFTDYNF